MKEQKAEIERLTEELAEEKKHYFEIQNSVAIQYTENVKLQKQVDELKEELEKAYEIERANIQAEIAEAGTSCQWCKQQAVKDTAQEALEAFICRLVNLRLVSTKGDLYVEMLEAKDDLLKEKYGVEVE